MTEEQHLELSADGNDHLTSEEPDKDEKDESIEMNNLNKNSSLRMKIDNLPHFMKQPQLKKFLDTTLPGSRYRRLKCMSGVAFLSFQSEEDLLKAIATLTGMTVKKFILKATRVREDPCLDDKPICVRDADENRPLKSAVELVSPLASKSYEEQLKIKDAECKRLANNLFKQLARGGVPKWKLSLNVLEPIIPSPQITGYRNKCEFNIGYSSKDIPTVGFVSGKMADKKISLVGVEDCTILSVNTRNIVRHFEEFIRKFDTRLTAYHEFKREGFWKLLTVRDFLSDTMIIVTVHPHPDSELVANAKKAVIEKFIRFGDKSEIEFRVTSIYWQVLDNASDPKVYEYLAGVPYIYEKLLDTRFRISPSTFFQTHSRGAEILYNIIGDALGLPKITKFTVVAKNNDQDQIKDEEQENMAKKPRVEDATDTSDAQDSLVILDICCGAGTISLCCMKRLRDAVKNGQFTENYGCVGMEIVSEAVKDAQINCADNGFSTTKCKYFEGDAAMIFKDLQYHMPDGCKHQTAKIVGVLDPPRAGVSDRVIIDSRRLTQMKRMVYVSCDPKGAMKNLVDLCRQESSKFGGEQFRIVRIQPIDLFPQTEHFEWVITLER
ncbi:tRNA (Uracil-5-)-methyltransferase domain-containing protein [Ditylenchus destructor]|uniref:tRNA (uracil(54)-C(5))-methyltransferase n=1 Tax=Ditylenchus destructor TaxID=166010 RepID=A0AAD4NAI1_9BILA|nr:tRNA (Uracil-5-)-methyltransferase domain-containing protein [Ditylenchus destructor]